MEAAIESVRDGRARQWLVVIAASVLGLVGLVVWFQSSSDGRSAQTPGSFGFARSAIFAAPGARLEGRIPVPAGLFDSEVRWRLASAQGTIASGDGSAFAFAAPEEVGEYIFQSTAVVGGQRQAQELVLRVAPVEDLAVLDLQVRGTVRVDGDSPVEGESLMPGTDLDTRRGEASVVAKVTNDAGKRGRIELSGSQVRLGIEDVDGQPLTIFEIERDGASERVLALDVEHLDGERYVAVQTPDAVAMVKGTRFEVRVGPRSSEVATHEGLVEVVDRFRLYVRGVDVPAGAATAVEALDSVIAAHSVRELMRPAVDDVPGLAAAAIAPGSESRLAEAERISRRVVESIIVDAPRPAGSATTPRDRSPSPSPEQETRPSGPAHSPVGDENRPTPTDDSPRQPAPDGTWKSPEPAPSNNPSPSPGNPDDGGPTTCKSWEVKSGGVCVPRTGDFMAPAGSVCGPYHKRWNNLSTLCVRAGTLPPAGHAYRQRLFGGQVVPGCHGEHVHHLARWVGYNFPTDPGLQDAGKWCLPYDGQALADLLTNTTVPAFRTTLDAPLYKRHICPIGFYASQPADATVVPICYLDP